MKASSAGHFQEQPAHESSKRGDFDAPWNGGLAVEILGFADQQARRPVDGQAPRERRSKTGSFLEDVPLRRS